MGKRKVILLLLAMAGIYLVASGGITSFLLDAKSGGAQLLDPLERAMPFDIALGVVALLLVIWVSFLDRQGTGVTRTEILRGIALGSAVMAASISVCNLITAPGQFLPELPAVLALVGTLHAFVGLGAACLLMARRESRGAAGLPLLVNGVVIAAVIGLFYAPVFTPLFV